MIHTKLQAWVYQGKEPAHFLQIFKGRMITYIGSATDYDRKFTSYIILITLVKDVDISRFDFIDFRRR